MKHSLTCLIVLASLAQAQSPFGSRHQFSVSGDTFLGLTGWSVAAGDVDGDGHSDLIVGAPSELDGSSGTGTVEVYSGRDGALLHALAGDFSIDQFGSAVAAVGDLNGDGSDEILIGAPQGQVGPQRPGYARVFDGATGNVLQTLNGDVYFDMFGFAVAGIGDLDLDGVPDLAIGAPRPQTQPPFSPGPGALRIFSGANFSVLATISGANVFDNYGHAVAGAGDVNLDGYPDIIVGIPQFDGASGNSSGRVEVLSGEWIAVTASGGTPLTPLVLGASEGTLSGERLGFDVDALGDVDADGYPEVLAGSPYSTLVGTLGGSVDILSGEWIASTAAGLPPQTPRVFDRLAGNGPNELFGRSLAGLPDVDGDGVCDFIVGAPESVGTNAPPGFAVLYSGATSDDIVTLSGSQNGDRVGWAVADGGDFNADGIPDVALGADLGSGSTNGFGTAHAVSSLPLALTTDEHIVSISAGGAQEFFIIAGESNGGRFAWLLGTASGTTPGLALPPLGLTLPLNPDWYFNLTLNLGATPIDGAFDLLDVEGEAYPTFPVPAGALPPALVAVRFDHAYVVFDLPRAAVDFVSNTTSLRFVP